MNLRTIPRLTLGASLRALRLPIDGALRVVGRGRTGETASIAVDRADAIVRGVAGNVLGDDQLLDDATRRFAAADERSRALRLRGGAEAKQERAEERKEQADAKREKRTRQAAASAGARKRGARETASKRKETVRKRSREDRLDAAEEKAEALERRDEALTARDEAARLAESAAAAKASRKNGG